MAHVGGGPGDAPIKGEMDLVDGARRVAYMLGRAVNQLTRDG